MGFLLQSNYFKFWSDHLSLSDSTKKKYTNALIRFETFLLKEGFEGELDFDRFHASHDHPGRYLPIQRKIIDHFVHHLRRNEKVTDSLLSASVTALKHFFGYLYDMDLIQHNPMLGYPTPKYERAIQNTALSKEECIAILKAALLRSPFYRQEFVFIWFMLITGLRISEVRFLRRKRLNLKTRIVHVFEGQKTDQLPVAIPKDLADELDRYIHHPEYMKWANHGEEYLFHHQGKIMTIPNINRMLSDLSRDAGLARRIRPHDLRRTAGYLMQIGGMNIVDIQHQLRHKELGTTLRYVPPLSDLARILENT